MGALVLLYEPRRGGRTSQSQTGGRSAFTGLSYIDRLTDDPEDPTRGYAELRHTLDFNVIVPVGHSRVSGTALQSAVTSIGFEEASRIVAVGLAVPDNLSREVARQGLTDVAELIDVATRPILEVVTNRRVRDASFRFRVVERAYNGVCALSGIAMTNGHGRAETDAAHIRPVANDGPDTVRNGIALMKSLHWAFDRGFLSLSDDGDILHVERGLDPSVVALLRTDRRALLPAEDDERPHPSFLGWHREHVFKGAA